MFKAKVAFSGFSVDDQAAAKKFYSEILGIDVEESEMGLRLKIAGDDGIFVYSKPDHKPATYTVLNFMVDDVEKAVDELASSGVKFEHYENMTDEKGIARPTAAHPGPHIAWFKDPAGNIFSVLH
jgi:predicted enzyme related to lactoylglutathione lyase